MGAIAASADTSGAEGAAAGETALLPSAFRCADRARGGRDRVPEPRRKLNTWGAWKQFHQNRMSFAGFFLPM